MTTHQVGIADFANPVKTGEEMARSKRFELLTLRFVV